jgi:hypothetical protein
MASGNYEYQSDFARRYVAQGKAEGRAEGRAHAVLAVLAARGLDVPEDVRARITACTELERLDAWLARAVTAASAADGRRGPGLEQHDTASTSRHASRRWPGRFVQWSCTRAVHVA